MHLASQLTLAVCLATLMTSEAAIKKTSPQELKKFIASKKSEERVMKPPSYQLQPPMEDATSEMPLKMPYLDSVKFRQTTTVAPPATEELKIIPIFNLRDDASAHLKAIPHIEVDRNSRYTHSIVFGLGGPDGYGFK